MLHGCDAEVGIGGLTLGVSSCDTLAIAPGAAHLRVDPTADLPFALVEDSDTGAVRKQSRRALGAAMQASGRKGILLEIDWKSRAPACPVQSSPPVEAI